jgi:thiol-disulfide isomerase/thioredoxin
MRLLCAAALSLSVGLFFAYAQDKQPDPRAAKLEAAKKKYEATLKELNEQLKTAQPGSQAGIQAEIREEAMLMAGKVLRIAEEDPKDAVALDAAAYVIAASAKARAAGADVEKFVALLAEHHATSPKVKDLLVPAMRLGDAGDKLLKAVSEKATDKPAKGLALLLRGYNTALKTANEDDEAQLALLTKAAIDLLEAAKKEAPDAKLNPDDPKSPTYAAFADTQIAELKAATALAVGKPAPDVESLLLDGKKVKLSDYKGKVVLLDVWATWCGPCRAMIPHERDMVKKLKDKPFVLVSVSVDDKKETLTEFLDKEPMPWVHWWQDGQQNPVMKKFRVRAFPTMYLLDHSGVIKHKWVGNPGNDKLDKAVDEAVEAAIKAKG